VVSVLRGAMVRPSYVMSKEHCAGPVEPRIFPSAINAPLRPHDGRDLPMEGRRNGRAEDLSILYDA
jgi:hypothetical protein